MDSETERNETERQLRPRWGRRAVLATGVVTLLAVGWLLWGTTPVLPDGPMVARRGANGQFTTEGSTSGSTVSGRVNELKLNESKSTMSSLSSSDNTSLLARSIAVFNLSEDLLAQRIGYELFQRLQKSDRFTEVRYLPHDESLPEGQLLPDLFATIDVSGLKEGGVVPSRTLEAEIRVTLGDQYRRSSHSTQATLTPPSLQFRWESRIECKAQNLGIETGSARYAAVSEKLAESIAKDIGEYLDTQAAKFGELDPPAEFMPAYTPTPDWAFLKPLEARQVLSGRGFMRSNVTVWKIEPKGTVGEMMKALADGLTEAGWPKAAELKDVEKRTVFRLQKGSEIVECFEQSDGRSPKTESPRVFVVYIVEMNAKDIEVATRALIARDAPEEELVPFSSAWHLFTDEVDRYFAKHPARLLPSIRHLARQAVKAKDLEAARSLVLRAAGLQRIVQNDAPSDELKKLAKEAGIEKLPELPDVDALSEKGVVDLRDGQTRTVRLAGSQPLVLLLDANDKTQEYILLSSPKSQKEDSRVSFKLKSLRLQDSGAAWSDTVRTLQAERQEILNSMGAGPDGSAMTVGVLLKSMEDGVATIEVAPNAQRKP
jgi:hypothetical protein